MKKCNRCVHFSIFKDCAYNVKNNSIQKPLIDDITMHINDFVPTFIMRSTNGQCGPNAKLYSSKYVHFSAVISITIISLGITFYTIKELILLLDKF